MLFLKEVNSYKFMVRVHIGSTNLGKLVNLTILLVPVGDKTKLDLLL